MEPIIAGNWKMHKEPGEARALVQELLALAGDVKDRITILIPPFTSLPSVGELVRNSRFKLSGRSTARSSAAATRRSAPGACCTIFSAWTACPTAYCPRRERGSRPESRRPDLPQQDDAAVPGWGIIQAR